MSRFTDFDDFLHEKDQQQSKTNEDANEHVKKQRQTLDPWVSDIFWIFKDYYDTILAKRRQYHMIFKKKEFIPNKTHDDLAYFLYRINLVPVEILPLAFDPSSHRGRDHLSFNHITKYDWHFDVSLQINVTLTAKDVKNETLTPHIALTTWGSVPKSNVTLLPSDISFKTDTAWHLPYTIFTLSGKPSAIKDQFEQTLILLTPYVFDHLETVWNIKK